MWTLGEGDTSAEGPIIDQSTLFLKFDWGKCHTSLLLHWNCWSILACTTLPCQLST